VFSTERRREIKKERERGRKGEIDREGERYRGECYGTKRGSEIEREKLRGCVVQREGERDRVARSVL
jgi:hypothetical protein